MSRHFLINAFPPTPEACRQALALPNTARTRHTRLRVCLSLLLCAVLLGGIACAASGYGVFRFLLGNAQPGDALRSLSQTLGQSAMADHIQITLTDLIYDGRSLALSYDVENLMPAQAAMVRLEGLTLNGQPAAILYEDETHLVPSLHRDELPVRRNPLLGGLTTSVLPAFSGQVTGEITFAILRPKVGFAIISDDLCESADLSAYSAEQLPDILDQRAAALALENAVIIPESAASSYADYAQLEPSFGLLSDAEDTLTETARVTIRFTFSAAQSARYDLRPAEDIRLADCTARIDTLWVSPLAVEATVYLLPQENTQAAAQSLAARYGEMTLLDADGQELAYADMDYLSGNQPDVVCLNKQQWVCRYMISMPGVEALPESVTLQAAGGVIARALTGDEKQPVSE